jgi:hypothetical protein
MMPASPNDARPSVCGFNRTKPVSAVERELEHFPGEGNQSAENGDPQGGMRAPPHCFGPTRINRLQSSPSYCIGSAIAMPIR